MILTQMVSNPNQLPESHLCEFCAELGGHIEGSIFHKEFKTLASRVLYKSWKFAVIPGLGAFVPGYLLIVPLTHYLSIAQTPEADRVDFELVKSETRKVLTEHYNSPIFFEHGPVDEVHRGGCCISHAHLHALPLEIDLTEQLNSTLDGKKVESIFEAKEWISRGSAYIYYETRVGQKFVYSAPQDLPSQYIRQLIATRLGRASEWDWLISINRENVLKTLADLSDWKVR